MRILLDASHHIGILGAFVFRSIEQILSFGFQIVLLIFVCFESAREECFDGLPRPYNLLTFVDG